jgi:flagellin
MVALQTLTQTSKDMQMTQVHISTGMRVANAADNAAYWSISTTMKSDNSALSAVQDALNLGGATIDVATAAMNSAKDIMTQIKTKLVAAAEPGIDRTKIQSELTQLQKQLKSVADSAVFSGQNWVSVDSGAAGYNATRSVLASFSKDSAGAISIGKIDIDITSTKLYDATGTTGIVDKSRTVGGTTAALSSIDISALTDTAADQTTLKNYITMADAAVSEITGAAANLGSAKSRVSIQQDFVSKLTDAITSGIGSLVDADMNKESTRLQALQVQQQLGVQSLSIANQNTQLILKLFG